jgi:glycerol 3-phosphatase-2
VTPPHATLASRYPGVICDLDGVVYRGSKAIPGAVETLNTLVAEDVGVVFATNNAARSPSVVGDHLQQLGLEPGGWSVLTSSEAAARYLAGRLAPRAAVLAVGGSGVARALGEAGLTPIRVAELSSSVQVEAVVQGAGQEVTWRDLAEVGYLAQAGAIWVATNLDATVPTSRGTAPGNGAFVGAVRTTTSAVPQVTGKPEAALFDFARARLGTFREQTIVVGDRLDTDIKGALSADLDSLLVLGGACTLQDLAFAPVELRPSYVAFGLSGLLAPGLVPGARAGDAVRVNAGGCVDVHGEPERHQLLRSVVAAAWAALDHGRALSADPSMWLALEERLGVRAP